MGPIWRYNPESGTEQVGAGTTKSIIAGGSPIYQRRDDRKDGDRGHDDIHLEDLAAVLNETAQALIG